jgi:hypothetical protein
MIIQTTFLPSKFDALTVYPFIFVDPTQITNKPLIAHELVHYYEHRSCLVLPWLIRYAFSPKFRLAAEVRGYRVQIDLGGISLDQAADMLTKYKTKVTHAQAKSLLSND